jgi:hypothetical protein
LRSIRSLVPSRARKIHFIRTLARNYTGIEVSVAASVFAHLPRRAVVDARADDDHRRALTFGLFIADPADVLMSHGLADKRYFHRRDPETGERMVNRFGHILVPGEWTKRRVLKSKGVELTRDRIHVVGWPRLDLLLERQRELAATDVPFGERRPRVLWAPTHDYVKRGPEQESTSTYPAFEAHLPALGEHADVEVSVHPRNRDDKTPTHDQLLWADFVVSDFGTMVYEAWALGKPVLFPAWILGDRIVRYMQHSTEAHIFREGIGLHPASIDELIDLVRSGEATPGADVTAFMAKYLDPSSYGRSGQLAAEVLDALRRGEVPGSAPTAPRGRG